MSVIADEQTESKEHQQEEAGPDITQCHIGKWMSILKWVHYVLHLHETVIAGLWEEAHIDTDVGKSMTHFVLNEPSYSLI